MAITAQGMSQELLIETELEDEVQPWEYLNSANLKRGQKDFEKDDTQIQNSTLQDSLDHMYNALSVPRAHTVKQNVKAYYQDGQWRSELKGNFMQTMGVVRNDWCYLTEEEIIYLVERGTVEPIWVKNGQEVTMDLQSVYAMCATDLVRYQVYSNLKRCGYIVQRYTPRECATVRKPWYLPTMFRAVLRRLDILNWFIFPAFTSSWLKSKFLTYSSIFESIRLQFKPQRQAAPTYPLDITFDVWKPDPRFTKKSPPLPDFQIVIVDVSSTRFPTKNQLDDLFKRVEYQGRSQESLSEAQGGAKEKKRLKDGSNCVLFALVDNGVINYMRLSQGNLSSANVITTKKGPTQRTTK